MKTSIKNLTFDAFKRWCVPAYNDTDSVHLAWQDLCTEAEKREPETIYAIRFDDGDIVGAYRKKEEAIRYMEQAFVSGTVIKLVEDRDNK